MKYNNIETTSSYNSIHPVYLCTDQLSEDFENYHEGTIWWGIFLAFISGAFFTISSALVKGIEDVDPMILLIIRSVLQIIVMLFIAHKERKNLIGPHGQRQLIQLQGLVGGMTLTLLYYSFRKLPLGDATTIIFSSPVIVIGLSFVLLKEPFGVLRISVMCALFSGVVLIARPPFIFHVNDDVSWDVVGYTCALLATVFTALNIVVMRKCLEIHYSIVVFNLSIWSLMSAIIFFFFVPMDDPTGSGLRGSVIFPKDLVTWCMILLVAFSGLAGQVLVAKALKIESASKVSVTRSLDIILSYVIQIYFFGEIPSIYNVFGAMLILLSVACMGFERQIHGFCDYIVAKGSFN